MKSAWPLIKWTIENWLAHKDARQGAALAYYSVFSVGPSMIIAIGIAGLAFGQEAARGEVQGQLSGILGQPTAAAIDSMLASANKPQQGADMTQCPLTTQRGLIHPCAGRHKWRNKERWQSRQYGRTYLAKSRHECRAAAQC